jgi:hypothetical protein
MNPRKNKQFFVGILLKTQNGKNHFQAHKAKTPPA